MSDVTTERDEIVRQLRRVGVSPRKIPEIADEAEDLVRTGEHPEDAVEQVLFHRAVAAKKGRKYRL